MSQKISLLGIIKKWVYLIVGFREFPIVPKSFMNGLINIKSGGTYLRVFSAETIRKVMVNTKHGYVPLIYMHPYDYLFEKEFWVDYKYFKNFILEKTNKYLRQNQWLNYGNRGTLTKIMTILNDYQPAGRMGLDSDHYSLKIMDLMLNQKLRRLSFLETPQSL